MRFAENVEISDILDLGLRITLRRALILSVSLKPQLLVQPQVDPGEAYFSRLTRDTSSLGRRGRERG